MIVTGASSGPLTSACSGTPSSVSTAIGRPRSCPNRSPAAGSGRSRSLPTAIFSAASRTPAPAAAAPTATPPTLVSRRHLAMCPPVDGTRRILGRGYPTVASRDVAREPGHDLIGDRPQRIRPFLRGRLPRVAGPEDDDLVARLGRPVTEIDDGLVHVHRAGDRVPAPPD